MRPERDAVRAVSRRRFLRGVGACVALPLFESLRPVLGILLAALMLPSAAHAVYADFTVSPRSPFTFDTVTSCM